MNKDDIESGLREIIIENIIVDDCVKIDYDTRFVEDLGLDSLDRLELLIKIEERFEVMLPDETVKLIIDFRTLVDHVMKTMEGKTGG